MSKLVIVESPTKAKTIGKFLGNGYKVIASNGHVRDLPKSQLGVDVEHNFEPKYITLRGRGEVLDKIRKEAKGADGIFLATDPDREGEAISWHLAHILKLDENSQCRIVFNEITSRAVKKSITQPRPIDINLVDAQQARRVLDRLVGYKISPILWAKVRRGLSAGRVQSVATRIICDREQEIMDFVPQEYWTITAFLKEPKRKKLIESKFYGYDGKKTDITCEEEAKRVLAAVDGKPFNVTDVKKTEKHRHAPAPFTTSSLQQEASRKLGFTTQHTMLVAQQLYEGIEIKGRGTSGLITYIRTDSVRVSSEAQADARAYIGETYGAQFVPEKPNFYKGRKSAQDAHEAIRPANVSLTPQMAKDSLSPTQYKLYKLIFDRFIASQMTPQRVEQTMVTLDANGCTFKTNGIKELFAGYTIIYTEGRDDAEGKTQALPEINAGDAFKSEKIESEQKFTQPPQRYTEASLVKLLEEKGIGRPSTFAPTITTIIARGYVKREKKILMPTELGFVVTQLMQENFKDIVDLQFTADMEEKLDEIEEGKKQWTSIVSEFYAPFIKSVDLASETIERVKLADEVSDVQCEKCGAMMVYKTGRFGRFLACPNYPECKNTKPVMEKIDVPCPKCGASIIKRKSKNNRVFYGCEKYPECDFVAWDKPVNKRCSKCGSIMVAKFGRTICSNKDCENSNIYKKARTSKEKGGANE